MAKNKWRIGAPIQGSKRALLLRMIRPTLPRVYCQSITYAYGVGPDYTFPEDAQTVKIVGVHRTPDTEALVCEVDGQARRPDGKLFHITLATAEGVAPARAGDINPERVERINPVRIDGVTFTREMLRPMKAEQNREAVAA